MKTVLLLSALLGACIYSCHAGSTSCGCAPGYPGPTGVAGPPGNKGVRGDMGETGIRGVQGATGLQGPRGPRGDRGRPGAEAPLGLVFPGPPGLPGPPGPCGCTRQYSAPMEHFTAGDYYLSDDRGYLNYFGNEYPEQYLAHRTTTTTTTTPPPPPQPQPPSQAMSGGLYIMSSDGTLIPFSNAQAFDLFGQIPNRPITTTTTTTTTPSPIHNKNNKVYIFGPKGTLIPLNVLGGIKKTSHSGGGHQSIKLTSNYNKWLRGMLMGEILPEYDEDIDATADSEDGEDTM